MTRLFDAGEVSRNTNISAEVVRDWRRRGFLDRIGQRNASGKWCYRGGDILALVIARWITDRRLLNDLGAAIEVAIFANPYIWERLCGDGEPLSESYRDARYIVANPGGEVPAIEAVRDVYQSGTFRGGAVVVLDCDRMAKELENDLAWLVGLWKGKEK